MKEQDLNDQIPFKKGMTLDEYFGEMRITNPDNEEEKGQENLFQTSKKVQYSLSKKLITYQIREIDEDNYDESNGQGNRQIQKSTKHSINFNMGQQRQSNIKLNFNKTQINQQLSNSRGFRVRRQSNSPFTHLKKQQSSLTPNKNLIKTLYNNEWKTPQKHQPSKEKMGSSTLYGKFLKGVKQKKNNEKYFKKKNTKQLDYVLKYQQNLNSKYTKYTNPDIRVDGFTDRLHERKNPKFLK